MTTESIDARNVLVLGIGNVLMGDEGIGVHVARYLEGLTLPAGVTCLDGGTGGFHLLGEMTAARRVILIDATIDGRPAGTIRRLTPKFSADYPRTLTAHDIGLKDMLDAAYLTGKALEVTLFAVSIDKLQEVGGELSPVLQDAVPTVAALVVEELRHPVEANHA